MALPVGPEPVSMLLQEWCQNNPLNGGLPEQAVLIMGLCGSLRADLGVGTPVIYRGCVDGRRPSSAPRLACDGPLKMHLAADLDLIEVVALTCDRIIYQAQEKQTLATQYGADIVDMEGYTALETLQKHNIPVTTLRVVSDDVEHDLPNLSHAISPEGQLQPLPMAISMIRQPVGALRLIRGSLKALKILEQLAYSVAKAAAVSEP